MKWIEKYNNSDYYDLCNRPSLRLLKFLEKYRKRKKEEKYGIKRNIGWYFSGIESKIVNDSFLKVTN